MISLKRCHAAGIRIRTRIDGAVYVTVYKKLCGTDINCEESLTYTPEQWALMREQLLDGWREVDAVGCGSTIVYNPRHENLSDEASRGKTCWAERIMIRDTKE